MIVKIEMDRMFEQLGELSSALLADPAYRQLRQMVDAFMTDKTAVRQYNSFVDHYEAIEEKEQQGLTVSDAEAEQFNQLESALYENDPIRRFLYAQNEFQKLQQTAARYLQLTLELDRIPTRDEVKHNGSCGCGGSCGSGH